MGNIYSYLKDAFQDRKLVNSQHPAYFFIVLSLLSIPLAYLANSICVGLFAATTLYFFNKENVRFEKALFWPVLLYFVMLVSVFWTIDNSVTAQALLKEIPLLIVPLCFMAIPMLSAGLKQKIIAYYSYGMTLYGLFYVLKAMVRFGISGDSAVFFYHELVTLDVNAIHVSVYMAVAFFFLISKSGKSLLDIGACILLFVLIFLLSSKNIILIFSILLLAYVLFYMVTTRRTRYLLLGSLVIFLFSMSFVGKIRDRFRIEYESAMIDGSINAKAAQQGLEIYNVSLSQAWNKQEFAANDYFSGLALRVFQCRIFVEMLHEDPIFFTGYGLNASYPKIQEKVVEHKLFMGDGTHYGYQKFNFHNQYVQNFAELGIFGFLVLIIILWVNLKNGINTKDFTHISFAILMISLFLTESFLWRQRGVTFFIMMYCVFNSATLDFTPEKKRKL